MPYIPIIIIKCGGTPAGDPLHSQYIDYARAGLVGVRIAVEARSSSSLHTFPTGSAAHLASYSMGTGISYPGSKAVGT